MTKLSGPEALSVMDEFMYVKLGMIWYLPSYWMTQVLEGLIAKDFGESVFYLALLCVTGVLAILPPLWFGLTRRVYYAGWTLTQEGSSGSNTSRSASGIREILLRSRLGVLARWLRPGTRALIVKDLRMFCRDTTQWAQFSILLALIVVYFINTRNLPFDVEEPFWKNILGFVNLAMTGFVLATLSIRFFFPMVSLEGHAFWLVGVAPISRKRFLWVKVFPSLLLSLFLGVILITLSNFMLKVDLTLNLLALGTVVFMSMTLTCLCIGLGARFPRFDVRSAAEIASGTGGILAMVLGLIYVGGVITLEAGPMHQLLQTQAGPEWFLYPWVKVSLLGVAIWSGMFCVIPLWLGMRSLTVRDM